MLDAIDHVIGSLLRALRWLALPVAGLLFLQWPLRDIVKAYSRDANDLGQWLFALFVAASVVAATRANAHLASDVMARRFSSATLRARDALVALFVIVPWAVFVAWAGYGPVFASVLQAERFADTGNFGYFIVKAALLVLLALMLLDAVLCILRWLSGRRT